jgi:Ca-activated chloride channel family protein
VVALLRRPLIGIGALVAGCAGLAAQTATFSSRLEAVRVDVLVTEDGRPVQGLKPADFQVFDNGVLQRVDLASFEEIPLNVMLALDLSASLSGERLDHLRAASRALLDGLTHDDRAGLITFGQAIVLRAQLGADLARVRAALDEADGSGNTALIDATYAGMVMGQSDAGRSLLLVFSDGVDTASWLSADAVLETARRSEVVIYGVEIGTRAPGFLRNLAATTGGRVLDIDSTQDLNAAFNTILEEFRQRYLISYSPSGVTAGEWHRLEVRVKGKRAVKARPGYFSEK